MNIYRITNNDRFDTEPARYAATLREAEVEARAMAESIDWEDVLIEQFTVDRDWVVATLNNQTIEAIESRVVATRKA